MSGVKSIKAINDVPGPDESGSLARPVHVDGDAQLLDVLLQLIFQVILFGSVVDLNPKRKLPMS